MYQMMTMTDLQHDDWDNFARAIKDNQTAAVGDFIYDLHKRMEKIEDILKELGDR